MSLLTPISRLARASWLLVAVLLLAFGLVSCQLFGPAEPAEETGGATVETASPTGAALAEAATDAPSATPRPTVAPPPTSTPQPTRTPSPTETPPAATATDTVTPSPAATATVATPTATATATSEPATATATAAATQAAATAAATASGEATAGPPTAPPPPPTQPPALPTLPPEPVFGPNILPNGSFEEGHYNQSGVAELQLPNGWWLEWEEGPTGYGTAEWDVWVRPEARVLSRAFLPPAEHPLFIFDGDNTVKIFKGFGAISFRLLREVSLEPGNYLLEISFFPDLVVGSDGGQKVFAPDPLSGEVQLIAGDRATNWILPAFGQKNVVNFAFQLTEPRTIRIGAAFRGRFAIANNGWFMDNWTLRRVE